MARCGFPVAVCRVDNLPRRDRPIDRVTYALDTCFRSAAAVALVTWKDEFNVGVEIIDSDHRGLVDIVNRLHDVLLGGGDGALRICDELIQHTLVHFANEEQWFEPLCYPRADLHRRMHDKLKERILAYRAELERDPALAAFEQFTGWLTHHIAGEDHTYGAWLNGQGIH
jgi:hemerythrin